ncbi:hypothetical protein [Pseudomonas sp. URMO17WK12:I11]|uniref:hypothetical protein n=1 Tax=Pseudomonas sp. URMO17WK12:I11 TaxID=1283291 RepID=UPI002114CAEF|nr:hypothetical protein [Pseudomonas sp. URMO17WK12:I11]
MPVTSLRKTCVRPSEVAKIKSKIKIKIKINSNSNRNSNRNSNSRVGRVSVLARSSEVTKVARLRSFNIKND